MADAIKAVRSATLDAHANARKQRAGSVGSLMRQDDHVQAAPSRPPRVPMQEERSSVAEAPRAAPGGGAPVAASSSAARPPSSRRNRPESAENGGGLSSVRREDNSQENTPRQRGASSGPQVGAFRRAPSGGASSRSGSAARGAASPRERGSSAGVARGAAQAVAEDRPSSVGAPPIRRPSSVQRERPPSSGRESSRDFVRENKDQASRPSSARGASGAGEVNRPFVKEADSNVPRYLAKVKRSVEQERRLVAEALGLDRENDGCPPGHRLLTEYERMEIVESLQGKQAELSKQHSLLPLKLETDGQRRRADALEKELRDVEKHMENFSKPRVLVRLDS